MEKQMALKHIGRITSNKKKVIVAYRVVPGEPDKCLIVPTESLDASEHDALMTAVESASGQQAYEFAEQMGRTILPDGRNMLAGFHTTGKMSKVDTSMIEMTPNTQTTILLSELNKIVAEQKGITVADLALKGPDGKTKQPAKETIEGPVDAVATYTESAPASTDGVISDEQLAAQYRSQADALFKEAKALREQAEELVPTKKKTTKKTAESA